MQRARAHDCNQRGCDVSLQSCRRVAQTRSFGQFVASSVRYCFADAAVLQAVASTEFARPLRCQLLSHVDLRSDVGPTAPSKKHQRHHSIGPTCLHGHLKCELVLGQFWLLAAHFRSLDCDAAHSATLALLKPPYDTCDVWYAIGVSRAWRAASLCMQAKTSSHGSTKPRISHKAPASLPAHVLREA